MQKSTVIKLNWQIDFFRISSALNAQLMKQIVEYLEIICLF